MYYLSDDGTVSLLYVLLCIFAHPASITEEITQEFLTDDEDDREFMDDDDSLMDSEGELMDEEDRELAEAAGPSDAHPDAPARVESESSSVDDMSDSTVTESSSEEMFDSDGALVSEDEETRAERRKKEREERRAKRREEKKAKRQEERRKRKQEAGAVVIILCPQCSGLIYLFLGARAQEGWPQGFHERSIKCYRA